MRWRATIAALAFTTALAGCGGSDDNQSKTTGTTSAARPATGAASTPSEGQPPTAPAPSGDLGYLTVDVQRAGFESLAAGIARARASSPAVRSFAARMLRERPRAGTEDAAAAHQLKLKIKPRLPSAAERDALRKLVPLTGARFDSAYLALERGDLAGDVSRATTAAARARAAPARSVLSKHLSLYRAELGAARSAR